MYNIIYVVITEGCIFCESHCGKVYVILFSRFTCTIPMECIVITEDEISDSEVTVKSAKFSYIL